MGAAIVQDGRVLCARRGAGGPLAGLWEFPGGKIEQHEDHATALTREIREELGCDIAVGKLLNTHTHSYPFARVTLHTYLCAIEIGTPAITEHSEIRWLRAGALHTLEWAPADIPAVTRLQMLDL